MFQLLLKNLEIVLNESGDGDAEDGLACFLACEEPDEFMLSQLFSLTLVVSAESLSEVTTFGLQVSSHMPVGLADIGSPVEGHTVLTKARKVDVVSRGF